MPRRTAKKLNRRGFLLAAASFAFASGCVALPTLGGPARSRIPLIGILDLSAADDPIANAFIDGLKQGLAAAGYVDSNSIVYEFRGANGNFALLPQLAAELIQLPVDVLVAPAGTNAALAAQQVTTVIPIVFVGLSDPVSAGLVASLAHPGGNMTGNTVAPFSIWGKQSEILAQVVPGLSRVGLLANGEAGYPSQIIQGRIQAATEAATSLGVHVQVLTVRSPDDVEARLEDALAARVDGLMHLGGTGVLTAATPQIAEFARQHRLPLMTNGLEGVQAGGLLCYGANALGIGRQAASYVDSILKGAAPGDLPVQEPTTFDLVVNQTTAQLLGITIPPDIANQVTAWIQ
jgi:putative ABC transport system substrate-binding protein